jgi:hypothetical protein
MSTGKEIVEMFESAIDEDALEALSDVQVEALLAMFDKAGY